MTQQTYNPWLYFTVEIPNWIAARTELSASAKLVIGVLNGCVNTAIDEAEQHNQERTWEDPFVCPVASITENLGMSVDTVDAALSELAQHAVLAVETPATAPESRRITFKSHPWQVS